MAIALSGSWRGSARTGGSEKVGSYLAVPAAFGIAWLGNSRGLRQLCPQYGRLAVPLPE